MAHLRLWYSRQFLTKGCWQIELQPTPRLEQAYGSNRFACFKAADHLFN